MLGNEIPAAGSSIYGDAPVYLFTTCTHLTQKLIRRNRDSTPLSDIGRVLHRKVTRPSRGAVEHFLAQLFERIDALMITLQRVLTEIETQPRVSC